MSNCNMHRCGVADFNLSFFLGFRRPWEAFERLIEKPTRNTDRKYPLSKKNREEPSTQVHEALCDL